MHYKTIETSKGAVSFRKVGEPITGKPATYQKVAFSSQSHGMTAGLIVESGKLPEMTIGEISSLYPVSEFRKMARLHTSPAYDTWDAAFAHSFDTI